MTRPPFLLHGMAIENVTLDESVNLIGRLVDRGREHGSTHQVATVNVDFLANAVDEPSVAEILRSADVCLADGMPLVWAGARMGMPLVERVAGADLVPTLFDRSQTTGWHVHIFGSSVTVADRAREMVSERFPDSVVTFDPGPMVDRDGTVDREALDRLAAEDADIVCVALGNPKQEHFIDRHRERIGAPVMIGVGGSLDMLVGERRRAPAWAQRLGLEWVVRAAQEPKRLGMRYAHDIRTMGPWFLRQWRSSRARRSLPGIRISIRDADVVIGTGATTDASRELWAAAAERLDRGGTQLLIDPAHIAEPRGPALNDRAVASMVGLARIARRSASPIVWTREPGALASTFTAHTIAPTAIGCDEEWHPEHRG